MTVASSIASSLSASWPKLIARAAQPLIDRTRPGCPGKVLAYDPRTRRATVQVQGQLVVAGQDGKDEALDIETAENVPVHFVGGGGFVIVHDVKPEDQGWISFSHFPLDAWKVDGSAAKVRAGRYALQDAQFEPDARVFSTPGVECPPGCMIVGAEDGPQLTFNRLLDELLLRALHQISIAAKGIIRLDAVGDVYIQERRVRPGAAEGEI